MKIGVFDSGVGGQSVAKAIQHSIPDAELLVREDRANLPYGNKTAQELLTLTMPYFEQMVADGCDIIVVACNTVSTNIIEQLRAVINVPLVAMEPMVKPAAEHTKTGIIAVCATPATLKSQRYRWLKDAYAKNITVLEPRCDDWAFMIENNTVDMQKIDTRIQEVLDQDADMIVLGCTHYHWIEQEIQELCKNRAKVIQPEQPVIAQLTRVIAQLP